MQFNSTSKAKTRGQPLYDIACAECSFKLHDPIKSLTVSDMALYNDARFRGRSILALREHRDSWEDIEPELLHALMDDSQTAVRAIKKATGCERVNIAALSNTVSHVHLHLIPRFPGEEADPKRSPWRDPRPEAQMEDKKAAKLIIDIKKFL